MIRILDSGEIPVCEIVRREAMTVNVEQIVADIVADVQANGDEALLRYTQKFDGAVLQSLEVTPQEIAEAWAQVEPEFLDILQQAAQNIRDYHSRQLRQSYLINDQPGILLGQKVLPLEKAGLYIPGGTAAYPSTVLMNCIPAKIAGVGEIIMVTPPQADGSVAPAILAAAKGAGVDRIFKVGGAQAIAALAYGTRSIPKVDKIVGPGNIYVATAKRILYGVVDIDMIAGPSEILVMADGTADPKFLAAGLRSQAAVDVLASAILLTTERQIGEATLAELEKQMAALSRKEIIAQALQNYGAVIVCRTVDEMVDLANELAPEHLEVMMENPMSYLGRLDNAGSIFLGKYAPEPLGDYYAGPNHVLPTSGTARFFSPLGVDSFIKKSSYIYYTEEALRAAHDDIVCIAEREQLTAHANSIKVRFTES